MGPRAGFDAMEKRQSLVLFENLNQFLGRPVRRLAAVPT
jgi:hypothetical protein